MSQPTVPGPARTFTLIRLPHNIHPGGAHCDGGSLPGWMPGTARPDADALPACIVQRVNPYTGALTKLSDTDPNYAAAVRAALPALATAWRATVEIDGERFVVLLEEV